MRPNPTQMKALSDSHHFHNFITVAILTTALIIGLQTYSELEVRAPLLHALMIPYHAAGCAKSSAGD
jgi:hypothetical protein